MHFAVLHWHFVAIKFRKHHQEHWSMFTRHFIRAALLTLPAASGSSPRPGPWRTRRSGWRSNRQRREMSRAASLRRRNEVATAAEEKISQSSHTIRLDGREIKYSATAGTLPIRLDDGKMRRGCSSWPTPGTGRT